MRKKTKKLVIILAVALIMAVSIVQTPLGYADDEAAAAEKVPIFLQEVLKFDLSKYNVTLQGTSQLYRPELGLTEITGKFTLKCETSELDVLFSFMNNTLEWCLVRVMKGVPLYSSPAATNFRDATIAFMQRYSEFFGNPNLSLHTELSALDFTKNTTTFSGNQKLEVKIDSTSSHFSVSDTFSGATYGGLGVSFENGHFSVFGDSRSYYRAGDPTVAVSNEQAVSLALEQANNFSYTYAGSEVKDFGIVENHISAELLTKSKYKPLELYPYWKVTLPLDNFYPGYVTQIVVEIWAGTSEVMAVYPLGVGGGVTPEDSPTPSPSPDSTPSSSAAASASPSLAPESSPSPALSSQSPLSTVSPYSSLQPTSSTSFEPTDNQENTPETNYSLWIVAAFAAVAAVVTCVFLVKRRSG